MYVQIVISNIMDRQIIYCTDFIYILTDVLVLIETLLGKVTFLKFYTQVQVTQHNRLVRLLPCSVSLTLDDIVKHIKGLLRLGNFNEL